MLPLIISAFISVALALYTWRNRKTAGALPFSIMMFILFQWQTSYIFQLAGLDLPTKIFWGNIMFIGVVLTPIPWLIFALEYTGRKTWVNKWRLALLCFLPVITIIVIFTNKLHHLFWVSQTLLREGGFLVLASVNGSWFWVHAAYTYLLIMTGLILIVRTLLRWPVQYRGQMLWILLATLTPLIANAVTIFQIIPIQIDLTPFAFAVTGIGMAYALFRHRLLDIAPIARDIIIDGMKDGIIVLDAKRQIVDINQAAQQIIGSYGEKQPIGKPLGDILTQWPELVERYREVLEAEDEISLGEGDAKRWYELNLSTLKDENKLLLGQVITTRDITERKLAEKQLREGEARFRQIVENASDLIYRTDIHGYFTYANTSALHAMGFKSKDEVVGKFYLDLTTPEARHKLKRTYQHQFASKTKNSYHEFPGIATDGSEIWFGQNVQLIYEGDQVIGFQALARNITAVKQAQDALRIARDQALEASRVKSQLLSKVSHELRTPLGGILGYAELLQGNAFGELNERQLKASKEIVESANYLSDMVNELLDEAQMSSSTATTLSERLFSPFTLLQQAVSGMDIIAQKKELEFSTTIDPTLPNEIFGDDRRIRQIIINLIGNAIKFTKEGSIHINVLHPDENSWEIQVIDTGIGISKEAQSYIFEPFRQADDAVTHENRGIGLGLSITKQLVELMHGRIILNSEVGKGSTFTVLLPIIKGLE
ncbi:MAG: PAS domain S-box protein [Anaerolineales bacterium]|nr:PAS domain S-box protein [Anaerolineales bacterium]